MFGRVFGTAGAGFAGVWPFTVTTRGVLAVWKVGFQTTFPELAERPMISRTPQIRPETLRVQVAFDIRGSASASCSYAPGRKKVVSVLTVSLPAPVSLPVFRFSL
jgi:hypothetical protein